MNGTNPIQGTRRPIGGLGRVRSKLRSQLGISMLEILLASLILAAVSAGAFNFYKGQHGQYTQQADVTDVQQNLRATMNELTRQIRRAGYRVYGQEAIKVLSEGTWLAVRYHDGSNVRTQLFFPFTNAYTGRTDLMTQLDGEAMEPFAEGIDSVRFTPGGSGSGTEWVTVDLVAKSAHAGFQTDQAVGRNGMDTETYLYRRLSSQIKLRNR